MFTYMFWLGRAVCGCVTRESIAGQALSGELPVDSEQTGP